MAELITRTLAGVDLGKQSVQFSIYDEGQAQMKEESFPILSEEADDYIICGIGYLRKYMELNELTWDSFHSVIFSMEDASEKNRELLREILGESFHERHEFMVITRFRAFVEYIFHQEKAVWDRTTLLLDYSDNKITTILVEQIRRSKERAYRASLGQIDPAEFDVDPLAPDHDQQFARMIKQYLAKNVAYVVFLTGKDFEGNWMKRTLNTLCAGRRVFMGQNLYANGACLLGLNSNSFMNNGMLLMQGPEMVYHTIGLIAQEAGRNQYVPITSIGKEWYNTRGQVDIIMDKSQKVEFFYHNTKENEIECSVCEVKDIPARPPKTTRMRISVEFTSATDGVIMLKDMGFGTMFPGTGKVTVFPFSLIS